MTYQQAGMMAIIKRILGWILCVIALLSTLISLLNYLLLTSHKQTGIDAVVSDFLHLMINMIHSNTSFLETFWRYSPVPDFKEEMNLGFWIIYFFIFIGLALQTSGARISRQIKYLRERIEDQLIIERAKSDNGLTEQQLKEKLTLPSHSILSQVWILFVLPIIVATVGCFILKLLGLLY